MEHNLLPGCILSCKELSAQSPDPERTGTRLPSITPGFADGNHGQRNTVQSQSRAKNQAPPALRCVTAPDPAASQFTPDFKGYRGFFSRESPLTRTLVRGALHQHMARALGVCSPLSSAPAPRRSPSRDTGYLFSPSQRKKKRQGCWTSFSHQTHPGDLV